MNKVDSFLVIMIVLLSGFFVIYKTAAYQFSGVDFERQKNEQLVRHIQRLELKAQVAALENRNTSAQPHKRSIASVPPKNSVQIKKVIDKNMDLMTAEQTAETFYQSAKLSCGQFKKEDLCTKNIEVVITQFPETRWAGESLILLGRLYLKSHQSDRAAEVIQIISSEFSHDKEIQSKLIDLQKGRY